MSKKTVKDADVRGKRILVRVDFNVPQDEQGSITDDTRIRAALPTIRYLLERGARVVLMSHLGRPKGKRNDKYSLKPVAQRLSELLGRPVKLAPDVVGPEAQNEADNLMPGDVLLLENLRFYPDEEENNPDFARRLAALGDIYVNDAFGTAHRAHASTEGVAHYLPAVAGFLMEKEISTMGKALENPARPFVAVIGGAKVSGKIGVLQNLLPKVDALLIGGGMVGTFLKAQGYEIGKSLVEDDKLGLARDLMRQAGSKLRLPEDVVVAEKLDTTALTRVVPTDQVPPDWMIVDIGPRTAQRYSQEILKAGTVIWNGPMGVFELPPFAKGTYAIAEAMANCKGTTIVGGGDSVAAVEQMGFGDRITHLSTGGGASLEFLEGRTLPGVAALQDS